MGTTNTTTYHQFVPPSEQARTEPWALDRCAQCGNARGTAYHGERPRTMCETGTCGHRDCHELAMGVRPATPVTVFQPLSNCVSSHEHLPCVLCGYDTGPVAAAGGEGGRSPLPWRARTDGLVVSGSGNVRFILRMERHGIAATLDDEDKACLNLLLNAVNAHASTLARVRELEEVLRELLSASIEVMVEQGVEDGRLRAANSEAMRVLQEGDK